jgi:hypothetical protein
MDFQPVYEELVDREKPELYAARELGVHPLNTFCVMDSLPVSLE